MGSKRQSLGGGKWQGLGGGARGRAWVGEKWQGLGGEGIKKDEG